MLSHHGRHGGAVFSKLGISEAVASRSSASLALVYSLLVQDSICFDSSGSLLFNRRCLVIVTGSPETISIFKSAWFILVLQFYMSGSSCPLQEAGAGDRKVSSRLHPCRGQSLRLAHGLAWAVWFGPWKLGGSLQLNSTQPLCHQYMKKWNYR